MLALEGLPLAAFWQRLLGFFADLLLAVLLWIPLEFSLRRYLLHQNELDLTWNFHEPGNHPSLSSYSVGYNSNRSEDGAR